MSGTFQPELIIAGLVLCLFGWTLYWAGLRLMGALCGAIAGVAVAAVAILFLVGENRTALIWGGAAGGLIGTALGVYLIVRAHYLLFFFTGAVAGLATAWVFEAAWLTWLQQYIAGTLGQIAYYGIFTLVGGLVIVLSHQFIVTLLTAFAGTGLFMLGLPPRYAVWLCLPVFVTSLVVQTGVLRALGFRPPPMPAQGPPPQG